MWRKGKLHALFLLLLSVVAMYIDIWKTVWRFLRKVKTEPLGDPEISLLGIFLKKTKALIKKNICIPTFIEALSTIAKIRKQSVSTNRSMDKEVAYIYNANGLLLSHKNNEILSFVITPMDLEAIMLSEISQWQILCDFTCMWNLKNKWTNITKQKQSPKYRGQTGGWQRGKKWEREKNKWERLRDMSFQLQTKRVMGIKCTVWAI